MRPNARKARLLLEDAMARDPNNPWAIHLYTHLMEAGGEAAAAVAPAKRLQFLVPGAPHLQVHSPKHPRVFFWGRVVVFTLHSAIMLRIFHVRLSEADTRTYLPTTR